MGANVSVINQSELNEQITNVMNSFLTNIRQSSSAMVGLSQTVNLDLEGANFQNCTLTVTENIPGANVSAMGHLNTTDITKLSDEIKSQIENALDTKLDQKNKDLNFGQVNVSTVAQNIKNILDQTINTTVSNSISNFVSTSATVSQAITVNGKSLQCKNGSVVFSEDATINAVSSLISATTTDTINKVAADSGIKNSVAAAVTQTNLGFSLLGGLGFLILVAIILFFVIGKGGGGGGGAYIATLIILLIVMITAIVLLVWSAPRKSKNSTAKTIFTASIIILIIVLAILGTIIYLKIKQSSSNNSIMRKNKGIRQN